GETEIQILMRQLEKTSNAVNTTSCGRILDAVAAVLGVCYERTYEGEPAMKLEATAIKGKDVLGLKPEIKGNVLNTTQMVLKIFENKERYSKTDLAYSAHAYLARGLATLAIEKALENGVKNVGFSGGVACNQILTSNMQKIVEKAGLKFFVHKAVPPGDGGLSFGQAVVGGFLTI
ncbi:carbamoyltransferase HypF, partial [Candidatus Bathyarchaeota archaeon]